MCLLTALRDGRRSFSELKRLVGNPRTLVARLKELSEAGLVGKDKAGLYALTDRGIRFADLVIEAERTARGWPIRVDTSRVPHQDYAPMLRRYVELLHERLGDRLRSVVLFGSVARGNWDESSDIDVLVVVDGWEGRLWDRLRVLLEVEGRLREGREYQEAVAKGYRPLFQPYPISTEEAQRTHAVYLDLVIDGVVLFDRDGFIAGVIEGVRRRLEGLGARRMVRPDGSHLWVLKEGARFGEGIEV